MQASLLDAAKLAEEIREMKSLRTRLAANVRAVIETHMGLLDGLATDDPEEAVQDGKVSYLTHQPRGTRSSGKG